MGLERYTRRTGLFGAIAVGASGTKINGISVGSVTVDPGSAATLTSVEVAVTVPGAKVGDAIFFNIPSALEDDLVFAGAFISGADEATVRVYNPTLGAVDGASLTWTYALFEVAG